MMKESGVKKSKKYVIKHSLAGGRESSHILRVKIDNKLWCEHCTYTLAKCNTFSALNRHIAILVWLNLLKGKNSAWNYKSFSNSALALSLFACQKFLTHFSCRKDGINVRGLTTTAENYSAILLQHTLWILPEWQRVSFRLSAATPSAFTCSIALLHLLL